MNDLPVHDRIFTLDSETLFILHTHDVLYHGTVSFTFCYLYSGMHALTPGASRGPTASDLLIRYQTSSRLVFVYIVCVCTVCEM